MLSIFNLVSILHISRRVDDMGVVHRLPTSPIACIPWDIVPAREVAHRGDTSRVHIDILIIFAAPALREIKVKNLVKIMDCDLHRNGGTKEVCGP